jgi:hypothetical protein
MIGHVISKSSCSPFIHNIPLYTRIDITIAHRKPSPSLSLYIKNKHMYSTHKESLCNKMWNIQQSESMVWPSSLMRTGMTSQGGPLASGLCIPFQAYACTPAQGNFCSINLPKKHTQQNLPKMHLCQFRQQVLHHDTNSRGEYMTVTW